MGRMRDLSFVQHGQSLMLQYYYVNLLFPHPNIYSVVQTRPAVVNSTAEVSIIVSESGTMRLIFGIIFGCVVLDWDWSTELTKCQKL